MIVDDMLLLPEIFTTILDGRCVVSKSLDECMTIYPISIWNEFVQKLLKLPSSNRNIRKFKRYFLANAEELTITQNLLYVPERFRQILGNDVLVCGNGNKIEVYNANAYPDDDLTDDMLDALSVYEL